MKFGVCCSIKNAYFVKEAGFDYFEFPFRDLTAMSDAEFEEFKNEIYALDFYPAAMNIMLPATARVTGDLADHEAIRPLLEKGFSRAAQLKTKSVVFGSSSARNVPEGFASRGRAYEQLIDFLKMAGGIAGRHDCTIVIEALQFKEANIVNFVYEGIYLTQRTGHPNVSTMVDLRHLTNNKESVSILYGSGAFIKHCHVPPPDSNEWDYKTLFQTLKNIGYKGGVSIEGAMEEPFAETSKAALALLKTL